MSFLPDLNVGRPGPRGGRGPGRGPAHLGGHAHNVELSLVNQIELISDFESWFEFYEDFSDPQESYDFDDEAEDIDDHDYPDDGFEVVDDVATEPYTEVISDLETITDDIVDYIDGLHDDEEEHDEAYDEEEFDEEDDEYDAIEDELELDEDPEYEDDVDEGYEDDVDEGYFDEIDDEGYEDVVDVVEGRDDFESIDHIADLIDEHADEEIEVDQDALADILDNIDDPVAEEIADAGNTLTLEQVAHLFELYFNELEVSNETVNIIDQSVNENTVINDHSVGDITIDNSVSIEVDNSDNSVSLEVDNSDNSINDSFNTNIENNISNFVLSFQNISLVNVITGIRRGGRENVFGTGDDDVIAAGPGRDRLFGRRGADSFVFDDAGDCGRRHADLIRDFRPRQGDQILLDSESFPVDGSVGVAESRREFRQLRNQSAFDFLYFEPKGGLYYNENGDDRGFGEGGLLATLKGSPELSADQIALF